MKLNLKNVFLSVGIFVFTFALFGLVSINKAYADTCTAIASGDWNDTLTWDNAPCNGDTYPAGPDIVIIPSNFTVTINGADAAATTLTLTGTSTLTISTTNALAVSGVTTIGAGTTLDTGATGVVSPIGTLELSGNLNIGAGAFDSSPGATHIYSTGILTFLSTAGAKTFAAVTVDAGGVYNESVAVATSTLASLTNAGTVTLKTGTHSLGAIVNTGTFNYSGGTTLTTLAASTLGLINYNGGDQTVQVIKYKDLTLSGSGVKVVGPLTGATQILGALTISGTAQASLTGDSTANALIFGSTAKDKGTWGSTSSSATHRDNTFAGTYLVDVATTSIVPPNIATTTTITHNADCSTTTTVTANGSVSTTRTGGPCSTTLTDTTAPMGMVSINAGALTTSSLSSTLTLYATDAVGVTQMLISNDAGFAGASWESYATSKAWTLLSGDGVKTVYAKFTDGAGNTSATVSDIITVSGTGIVTVVSNEPTQGCSGGNQYNTSTGALCVNNAGAQIPGCGNKTTGFSTASGLSCSLNRVMTPTTNVIKFTKAVTTKSLKADIEKLQTALNTIIGGGVGTALLVDGQWGPKTTFVVKAFQKANGLTNDGKVGPKTMAKLNALLGL